MHRVVKVALAAFAAIFCLMYAVQNVMNLQAAHGFVALVLGMGGHQAYPAHFGPAIQSPTLVWIALISIITLELLAGLLAARAAYDLWRARKSDADQFNAAKTYALLGTGLAVIIWFGLFSAIGGAYFQMWQTGPGSTALQGSFW